MRNSPLSPDMGRLPEKGQNRSPPAPARPKTGLTHWGPPRRQSRPGAPCFSAGGGGASVLSLVRQSSHIRRQGRISHIRLSKNLYKRRTQGTEIVPLFCHFTAIFSSSRRRRRSYAVYKKNKSMMEKCNIRFGISSQAPLSPSPSSTHSNAE